MRIRVDPCPVFFADEIDPKYTFRMLKVHRDIAGPCLAPDGCVLAIGAFDGLHRGHAALIERVRARARECGLVPAVASFEPLPRAFFSSEPLARLSSLREKLCGLSDAGIEHLLLLRFDTRLASMAASDFVRDVLVARMGAKEIWVGAKFRFGHRRAGDVELLRRLGAEHGFEVHVLETVATGDGERVSASRIRETLAAGDFAHAARLLGRPFAIGGRVVRGQRVGRDLGYPTANLRLGKRVSPIAGIFAVRVHGRHGALARSAGAGWPAVASLGVRPTIASDGEPLLEVHLFDFDGDLYGQRIEVEFVAKLREEERFDDLDALKAQMDLDAVQARSVLNSLPGQVDAKPCAAGI
jgi:riboflavin kinase/FMN adenylyltransferase